MWSHNYLLVLWSLFTFLCMVSASDSSIKCHERCECKWSGSNIKANCVHANFTAIPDSLGPNVWSLDVSYNKFPVLAANAFLQVGLVNLEKIYLQECQIREIDKDAFRGLKVLTNLGISYNNIHTIHPDTFIETVGLTYLFMYRNPIQVLSDGLFRNLTSLETVDFSDCNISSIAPKTFDQVPKLRMLDLNGNQLTHIQLSVVESLTHLRVLRLWENPWRCDCHLRELRNLISSRDIYTGLPSCAEPSSLRNQSWESIDPEKLLCEPKILYPPPGSNIKASGENVTLSCKVYGNPLPSVDWIHKSLAIGNNTSISRYEVKSSNPNGREDELWYNLTISNIRSDDKGEYSCAIKSSAGIQEFSGLLITGLLILISEHKVG